MRHSNGDSTDDDSKKPANQSVELKNVAPDGGWGWVVVFGSFICNATVDGISYSIGLILAPVKEEFHSKESVVNTIGSIQGCLYNILGPLVSILVNRFGFRRVSMAGSVLAAFGFGVSFFANSVEFLCLTYGVIAGTGFSMVFLPSILIVGFYFERWRALSTGIAVCGSGVGTLVVTPLTEFMVDNYGWRLAVAVQACLLTSCFIASMFYKPLPQHSVLKDIENNMIMLESKEDKILVNSIDNAIKAKLTNNDKSSEDQNYRVKNKSEKGLSPLLEKSDTIQNETNNSLANADEKLSIYSSHSSLVLQLAKNPNSTTAQKDLRNVRRNKNISTLKNYLELLKSPTFILLALNGSLYMSALLVPYTYTVKRARLIGGVENTMWYIPTIGLSNTIGRVACGLISSIESVSTLWFHNLLIIMSGLVIILSGISYEFYYQLSYSILLGIGLAAFPTLRSILATELLGLEKLTNSFGLLLLFQAVGMLLGAPIAGAILDTTGDFDAPFYFSGGLMIFSAALLLPVHSISKWEQSKRSA